MRIDWCAVCPTDFVPVRAWSPTPPSPRSIAAKIHSVARSGSKPSRQARDVLDPDDFKAFVTLAEFRRAEGTLPAGAPIRSLATQRAVAERYGVSPALLSQWIASYRWLVSAGLAEAERRSRMGDARALYHQKDRSGSSSGVRVHVGQECSEIALADPTDRARLWDELNEQTRRLARAGEMAKLESVLSVSGAPNSTPVETRAWREYDDWNAALTKVVYTADRANEPAYLDIENDLLEAVAEHLERDLTAEQTAEALCRAVRDTLVLGDQGEAGSVFSRHRQRLDLWRSRAGAGAQLDDPPPVVALLAVFARAAELMQKDDSFNANAYFPRLNQVLDITAADNMRVQTSFRRESERLWGALNDWLTGLDGALGLSTAEAIGQRYVGIPLSQALIRAADRHRFGQFFAHADLEPAQVQQWVHHDLTGPVICHLTTTIHMDHGGVARHQHVFGLAGLAKGEHRVVLDQPQLILRIGTARIGETLHRTPDRLIRLPAKVADDGVAQIVHFTSG